MSEDGWYRWDGDNLLLSLRVQPRSRKDQFIEPYGDHYKVQITAPPIDGKANDHIVKFLANSFGVRRSQVSLQTGQTSRNKLFRIELPTKFPIPVTQR
jgi:uncharacterized protein (TIGR00251 family)